MTNVSLTRGWTPQLTIIALAAFAIIIGGGYVVASELSPRSIDPPLLRPLTGTQGGSVGISGSCYPGATVFITSADQLLAHTTCTEQGDFTATLSLTTEKEHTVTAKQQLKRVTSDYSAPLTFTIDLTPPTKDLVLDSLPKQTKEGIVTISGHTSERGVKIIINGKTSLVDAAGNFSVTQTLTEGNNTFDFKLADEIGNTTDTITTKVIVVDTTPPSVSSFCLYTDPPTQPTAEIVCLRSGRFEGPYTGTAYAPIEGKIRGKLKEVTYDGKKITADENGDVFQRVPLYMNRGTNKFKIVATDQAGNTASSYSEIDWGDVEDDYESEVLDRLDGIESQIDD